MKNKTAGMQEKVLGSILAVMCRVCMCFPCLSGLLQVKDTQGWLTGDSKLTVDANVSVNGCLCVSVSGTW